MSIPVVSEMINGWRKANTKQRLVLVGGGIGAATLGFNLGQGIIHYFNCLELDEKNVEECALIKTNIDRQIDVIRAMSSSGYVSEKISWEMNERLSLYDRMVQDQRLHIYWFEAQKDRLVGFTWSGELKDGVGLLIIQVPNSDKLSSEAIGVTAHEALIHATDDYERYLTTGSLILKANNEDQLQKEVEDNEYHAAWFGDYVEAVARFEHYDNLETQEQLYNNFGANFPIVTYRLEQQGYDDKSQLYRFLFDTSIKYIWTHDEDTFLGQIKYHFFVSDDKKKDLQRIFDKWKSYPTKGSKDWFILKNLIGLGLVHPSFLPSEQTNYISPQTGKQVEVFNGRFFKGYADRRGRATTKGFYQEF